MSQPDECPTLRNYVANMMGVAMYGQKPRIAAVPVVGEKRTSLLHSWRRRDLGKVFPVRLTLSGSAARCGGLQHPPPLSPISWVPAGILTFFSGSWSPHFTSFLALSLLWFILVLSCEARQGWGLLPALPACEAMPLLQCPLQREGWEWR